MYKYSKLAITPFSSLSLARGLSTISSATSAIQRLFCAASLAVEAPSDLYFGNAITVRSILFGQTVQAVWSGPKLVEWRSAIFGPDHGNTIYKL